MIIKAKCCGSDVLINTNYIVDVWSYNDPIANAYLVGNDTEYKIEHDELQRWLDAENKEEGV